MTHRSSSFISNVLKLASGSTIAQGVGILTAPILTRLFAPEAFGIAALFTSISSVIGVLACLRYEYSIMLPKSDKEASNLLGVSVFFVLLISLLSAVAVLLAGDLIATFLQAPKLKRYLWVVPLAVLINGFFLAFNYWNTRTMNFGRLSIARVLSSVVSQTAKLGAGFAGYLSAGVLIVGSILGSFLSAGFLGIRIWQSDHRLFKASIRWGQMIAGLKRHKKFPIYGTWAALVNKISQELPTFILALYFSPKVVGYFALARTVLSQPSKMLGTAISQVFFQKATDTFNRTANLPQVVREVFERLVSIAILPIFLLTLIGKDIFVLAFGSQWAEAGVYVQILAMLIFFQFIFSPISMLFAVLEKQRAGLLFNLSLIIAWTASLILGGTTGNSKITLLLFSLSGTICYASASFWLASTIGIPITNIATILLRHFTYIIPFLIILAFSKFYLKLEGIQLFIPALLLTISYYSILFFRDKHLKHAFGLFLQKLPLFK